MDKISIFDEIKKEFFENYDAVCEKQGIDVEKTYYSRNNLENLFDTIRLFLSSGKDKTTKQAIALEIINKSLYSDISILEKYFVGSPIEYLLLVALQKTMPFHISQQAYLMPQVYVCNNKYRLDIGLFKRTFNESGNEGSLILGIECDGYDTHYSDKRRATDTVKRIREIKMVGGIEVFQYTGTEIYSNAIKLANDFWTYVEEVVFPVPSSDFICDYDEVYQFVSQYIEHPELVENFFVYQYMHIDVLEFMPSAKAVLSKYKGCDALLDKIREKLRKNGWEGDGEIQLLWLPPFCDLLYEDTYGMLTWFVKQDNNGVSFICSPHELNFKRLL